MHWLLFVIMGLISGAFSGLFGIGGATILIPALVYIAGFEQRLAQGTTLAAFVLPIGLLAAWKYWQHGNVKLSVSLFICLGFFVGAFLGAILAQNIPSSMLKKMFGIFLLLVSFYMILGK